MKRPHSQEELRDAARTLASLLQKLRKARQKLARGSAQDTLAGNRVKALRIAQSLIKARLRP